MNYGIEDQKDNLFLWQHLGDNSMRHEKSMAYKQMMARRNRQNFVVMTRDEAEAIFPNNGDDNDDGAETRTEIQGRAGLHR